MPRRRALALALATTASVIAVAVGGVVWLAGVAFLGVAFVVLVASL